MRTIAHRTSCPATHRSWRTLAHCLWPRAVWVAGDGPYATVSACRRPGERGDQRSVLLHQTQAAAEAALRAIDDTGCGGYCQMNHALYRLTYPALEV